MKIKGQLGEYIVKWGSFGFTGTRVYVYVPSRCFFGLIPYNKYVWRTIKGLVMNHEVEHLLPDQLKKWLSDAVKEYETYKLAWDKENKQ